MSDAQIFPPSASFAAQAVANDPEIYARAAADPEAWWASWADQLDWFEPYGTVCEFEAPNAKWFLGGKLNACHNCVDRHAERDPNRRAMVFEGEPGDVRTLTYGELRDEVARLANALKSLGIGKGDRVLAYMPMMPELAMTMLACARIGAVHTVVFGGFSADAIHERANDAGAKLIVTADGGWRRGKIVPLLDTTVEAMEKGCPTVENLLVLRRAGDAKLPEKAVAWESLVPRQSTDCPCEPMDSEDPLYILYTSGSTGKPKGIVHTTGGYLTGVFATSKLNFDLRDDDLLFCTADLGWVTGHSYIVYGPMANGATVLMYEGAPDTPDKDRFWRIVEKHRATILYTAPTAIRSFMKWGDEYPQRCDLSSLRLLGSVGEPINPGAWLWYHEQIGGGRCPIEDTWWQTETGAHMIAPLPGFTLQKPGSACHPFPGVEILVVDEEGGEVAVDRPGITGQEKTGFLVIRRPWPSMARGIWNEPQRFVDTYWSKFPGRYFAGDGVRLDEDGYLWLLGRVDDIMLVAGHNISTAEVESALVSHPAVAEAAVIGKTHEIKGQAISAFVILRSGQTATPDELKKHVADKLGAVSRPDDVFLTAELPKTRSGKIMRRLLRDVAEGRALGDTTTLADPSVVAALKEGYEEKEG